MAAVDEDVSAAGVVLWEIATQVCLWCHSAMWSPDMFAAHFFSSLSRDKLTRPVSPPRCNASGCRNIPFEATTDHCKYTASKGCAREDQKSLYQPTSWSSLLLRTCYSVPSIMNI